MFFYIECDIKNREIMKQDHYKVILNQIITQ